MRTLERVYSKSEHIVARARFAGWAFLGCFVLAAVLGGIVAVLWIFGAEIEKGLDPAFDGTAKYLTPETMKWVLLGVGLFVLFVTLCRGISLYRREIIVTEDKFLFKSGVANIVSVMLPLDEIRYVDVKQNVVQVLLGYGKIRVITDGNEPFVMNNIVRPERFARRIMKQCSFVRENHSRTRLSLDVGKPVAK